MNTEEQDRQKLLEMDCREAHDKYFGHFGNEWVGLLADGRYKDGERPWESALAEVRNFEKTQVKVIHKGSAYYFWAITCILNEDLEKGFFLMHQALKEDIETAGGKNQDSPAYCFVTLNHEKQDQLFGAKVKEVADFLDARLSCYRSSTSQTLTLQDFRERFLAEYGLSEMVFLFVFQLFHLKRLLTEIDRRLTENVFASLLHVNCIFSLCLVIDNALREKNPDPAQWRFSQNLIHLSSRSSLELDSGKVGEINSRFGLNFQNTLADLLDSEFAFADGTTPIPIARDLAIAYGFRNFGAHRVEDQSIVCERFQDISQRILNSMFFTIETLH